MHVIIIRLITCTETRKDRKFVLHVHAPGNQRKSAHLNHIGNLSSITMLTVT